MRGLAVPRMEPPEADAVLATSLDYFACRCAFDSPRCCLDVADEWEQAVSDYVAALIAIAAKE